MGEEGNGADAKEKKGTGAVGGGNGKATTNKKNNGGGGGGQGNSNDKVVLRVELHCDGCARKVKKAIKAAQGPYTIKLH